MRTTCDAPNKTLQVLAARPLGTKFAEDPMSKRVFDWTSNRKELYGVTTKLSLCPGVFDPSAIPITPKGLCEIRNKLLTTSSPLSPNGTHRGEDVICGPSRPVMMSINITPSCHGESYACNIANNANGVPVTAGCAIVFLQQNPGVDAATKAVRQAHCDSLSQSTSQAIVQGVCCDF